MTLQVTNATGSYRVALSQELWRTSALVVAPLLDEWTQDAPSGVTARAVTARTFAHVTGSTLVVTGLPEQALQTLATAPAEVVVELRRGGRPAQRVVVTVPMGSTLPYQAPVIAVASSTIRVAGRVTARAFPHGPISGAALSIAGVVTPLITLSVPLAIPHRETTTVRLRSLAAGAGTTLTAPIAGGMSAIPVLSTAGIGVGTLLAIGDDIVVAEGTSGMVVRLRTPIAASAADGAAVVIQTPGATGAAETLGRDAVAGDGLLPVSGALAGPVVEIVDGLSTEYRRTTLTTDADGRWRLSGVRGIPEIDLTTSAPGFLADGPRRVPLAPVDPFVLNTSLRT